ncbi:hypothetical protein M513_05832 [Trichuris suis]|uniref:Uncharacterized protein n=1 Tax=Trichuris suis TaxID=68888 RepID=A0A085M805_9BILA|nr:hypothetical protein M513_05832 [Trichuris suis]
MFIRRAVTFYAFPTARFHEEEQGIIVVTSPKYERGCHYQVLSTYRDFDFRDFDPKPYQVEPGDQSYSG